MTTNYFLDYLNSQVPGLYSWLGQNGQAQLNKLAAQLGEPTVANLNKFLQQVRQSNLYLRFTVAGKPQDAASAGQGASFSQKDALLKNVQNNLGDFYANLSKEQLANLGNLADMFMKRYQGQFSQRELDQFLQGVKGGNDYGKWVAEGSPAAPPPPPSGGDTGGGAGTTPPGGDPGQPPLPVGGADLMAQITDLLQQWGLPSTLSDFIRQEIVANKGSDEIINDIRGTAEYKAAFPENSLRIANGFSAWSESQILEYRDQAKQLAKSLLGIDVSNADISGLIENNKSLDEWSSNLQTYSQYMRYGPAVQQALSQELGFDVSDAQTFAFLSPDISTPDLDLAYQKALMRGQPDSLGLGLRPEEEADLLVQYGINPQQAFAGYQNIAGEMPREQRLSLIDKALQGGDFPPPGQAIGDADFSTLFRAIQLQDPNAIQTLQGQMARETARWQSGGGAARSGSAAIGLLTPDERGG